MRYRLFFDFLKNSGRSSTRTILPQRFFNMVNDDKARLFTEGRSSTEDIPISLPSLIIDATQTVTNTQLFSLKLTNALDRPLSGT